MAMHGPAGVGLSLLAFGMAPLAVASAPTDVATPLAVGTHLQVDADGGEARRYALALAAGRSYRVVIVENEVDLQIEETAPGGPGPLNTPLDGLGRETLLIEAAPAVSREIVVRALDQGARGSYTITLEAVPAGAARLRAMRADAAAARAAAKAEHVDEQRAVIELYGAAAQAWSDAGQPAESAHALFAQCVLRRTAGERPAALADCEEAARLWRQAGERRFAARATVYQGLLLNELGRSADAERAHRATLAEFTALGDERSVAVAQTNLGLLLHYRGELDAAVALYRAALAIHDRLGQRRGVLGLLNNLGGVHFVRGEAREAREFFQRAVAEYRALGDRGGEAGVLGNLALLQRNLGDLRASLATQLQVLAMRRETGDREGEARAFNNIGLVYLSLGEIERARGFFDDALRLRRATSDRLGEIATLRNLAIVEDALGARDLALGHLARSQELAAAAGNRRLEAQTRLARADLLRRTARPAEARAEYDTVVEAFRTLDDRRNLAAALLGRARVRLADDVPGAGADARAALDALAGGGYAPLEAQAHQTLALAARAGGDAAGAWTANQRALAQVESLRARVGTPELRASYATTVRDVYELGVELAMARHMQSGLEADAAQALGAAERVRARAFRELLGAPQAGGTGSAAALRARFEELQAELNARSAAALEGGRPAGAELVLAELDAVTTRLREADPAFAELRAPRPLSLSEMRELIDGETALLEYMVGERESWLWVLTRERLSGHRLPARAELERWMRGATDVWSRRVQGADAAADAARLAAALLPTGALPAGIARLAIVADGPLEYLPFAALPHPAGRRLIETHEVVMIPSASALAVQRRALAGRAPAPRLLAVVADPVFGLDDPRVPSPLRTPGAAPEARFAPLPGTRAEAEMLVELAGRERATLALGYDAARQRVLDGGLGGHRFVHLATHGVVDASLPAQSGLMLSRFGPDGRERPSFLDVNDVAGLALDADLVVLSACDTALGRELRGEGLVGLTRGFMQAGARSVVATLWRVPDRATAEFMRRFYAVLLRDGLAPSAALRRTQLDMARERRWRDPHHWAAFTLQGDWRWPG